MLSIREWDVAYGKSKIVNKVNIDIETSDKVCLMGRNGVGKTTLLKSIMGLLYSQNGWIVFDGDRITRDKTYQRSRKGMAYVPQGREIIPMFTVRENLELGSMNHHPKETNQMIEEVLDFFPALKEHLNRKGGVLSGGQQQQLAISRALMSKPSILFLDEPSEGIQPNVVAEIASILNRVHKQKSIALFIVEQNLEFALKVTDRYYMMEKGEIVANGYTKNAYADQITKYLTL